MELQKVELIARLCETCPKMCRHVCTTHAVTRSEADTPNERASIAYRALLRGHFLPAEVPYMYKKCTACGLCLQWCETGIDVSEVMLAARADLAQAGMAPGDVVVVMENMLRQGNPFGELRQEQFGSIFSQVGSLPDRAEVLYFAGCETLYRQPEIAMAVLKILRAAEVDFTMLKDGEPCCGEPQRQLGFIGDFFASARKILAMIQNSGARRVVYTCPSCLHMVKEIYPRYGIRIPEGLQFQHISEFILELINEKKLVLKRSIDKRITYHDPCDLGRRLKIYEPPRQVLEALTGMKTQEMFFNRQDARCCGAGGGLQFTNPGLADKASKTVVDLAQDISAELLVTACPACKTSFRKQTDLLDNLDTLDLTELVAGSLS